MRTLARNLVAIAPVLGVALALASCGGETPPAEGYEIRMRFVSLDPSVLENVRVTFNPGGAERFLMVEPMTYEDGAIAVSVAADGVLVMTLSGAHVASRAVPQGDGSSIYALEVWTSDAQVRTPAPGVRVVGNRASEAIAEGFLFLPEWPVPSGGSTLIPVTCLPDAASRGLCRQ